MRVLDKERALLVRNTRRLWEWMRTREGVVFCALFLLALAIRLAFAPYRGFFRDLATYVRWGYHLDQGLLGYYASTGSNYPPLSGYISGVLVATCKGVCQVAANPDLQYINKFSVLALWMKAPELAAEMVTIAVVYAVARKVVSVRAACIAAASFAFAPAVLFDGAIWGQTDAIFMLCVIFALFGAARGLGGTSGALLAVALMLKPQPIIFMPLILVYLFRWFGWRQAVRCAAAIGATCLVVAAPYLLPPQMGILTFAHNVEVSIQAQPFASTSGLNLWWFAGIPHLNYQTALLGGVTVAMVGDACFAIVALIALAGVWVNRSAGHLFASAGVLATGFFVLTTLQHERYLYPAIALFLVAAIYDRRYLRHYVVASLTTFLNMAAIVALFASGSNSGLHLTQELMNWLNAHSTYLVVVAAVNLWLLASVMLAYSSASWRALRGGWDVRQKERGVIGMEGQVQPPIDAGDDEARVGVAAASLSVGDDMRDGSKTYAVTKPAP